MKSSSFGVLAAVALAALAAAIWAVRSREAAEAGEATGGALFPALLARVNDVASITIEKGGKTLVIERAGDRWTLPAKGGYPVAKDKVAKLVLAVAQLEIQQPTTSDAAKYPKLEVQDPAEGASSARVALAVADGSELAELVVGKTEWGSKPSVYVRRHGEAQSYRCAGELSAMAEAKDWVELQILSIERDRVQSIEIAHADAPRVLASRGSADEVDFAVADVPEGRALKSAGAASSLGSALSYLSLDDLAPVGEIDFTTEKGPTSTFRTFDGLVVTVETKEKDGKTWAHFLASYAPPAPRATVEPPPAPAPPADAAVAEPGVESGAATGPSKDEAKSPDAVQKEVEDLNQELAGWAFALPSYKASTFKQTLEGLLAPLPVEPEPAPDDPLESLQESAQGEPELGPEVENVPAEEAPADDPLQALEEALQQAGGGQ
jgi:hypothetical protein